MAASSRSAREAKRRIQQMEAKRELRRDQEKRRVLYEKAATKVTEQAMGIFVYNTKWYGPYAANVGGIRFSPIGSGQDMRWAYYK